MALKSFKEQAAYGLPFERKIAEMAAALLFPEKLERLEFQRLPKYAHCDFLVWEAGEKPRLLCAIEVKRRKNASTDYSETILPATVLEFAYALDAGMNVPTFGAIMFTDGLAIVDATDYTGRVNLRTRRGKWRAHLTYKIKNVMRAVL